MTEPNDELGNMSPTTGTDMGDVDEPNDEDRAKRLVMRADSLTDEGCFNALVAEFAAVRAAERERCEKAALNATKWHPVRGGYSNTFAGGLLAAAAAIREMDR